MRRPRAPTFLPVVATVLAGCTSLPDRRDPPLLDRLRLAARRGPLVVAHRGASAERPENTLPAIEHALGQGAQIVEVDVFESADGVWLCMHDETLDRTTDAAEKLGAAGLLAREQTSEDLRSLDAGSWMGEEHRGLRLPTLEEALQAIWAHGGVALVDCKSGRASSLLDLLTRLAAADRTIVNSTDWQLLAELHAKQPELLLSAAGLGWLDEDDHQGIARSGARLVHWRLRNMRVEDLRRLQGRGLLVGGWTANGDAEMVGAAVLGFDFLTTDLPARLEAWVGQRLPAAPDGPGR